jgi:hypothetical protein
MSLVFVSFAMLANTCITSHDLRLHCLLEIKIQLNSQIFSSSFTHNLTATNPMTF